MAMPAVWGWERCLRASQDLTLARHDAGAFGFWTNPALGWIRAGACTRNEVPGVALGSLDAEPAGADIRGAYLELSRAGSGRSSLDANSFLERRPPGRSGRVAFEQPCRAGCAVPCVRAIGGDQRAAERPT